MLRTGHRHRVTDALNETHAHLAPRKHTEAFKVCSCATRERFYCESFYVLPEKINVPADVPTCKKNLFEWLSTTVDQCNEDQAGIVHCWEKIDLLKAWERAVQVALPMLYPLCPFRHLAYLPTSIPYLLHMSLLPYSPLASRLLD